MLPVPQRLMPLIVRARRGNRTLLTRDAATKHLESLVSRPTTPPQPRRLPGGISVKRSEVDGWPVYTVTPSAGSPRGTTVFIHGGGWVGDLTPIYWPLMARIAKEANTRVVAPIYPLLPHSTAAEVIPGVASLVRSTLEKDPETRLFGDSAGGQIALSAALMLRDSGITVPHTVLLSPVTDVTLSNPEIPDYEPHDPWLAVPGLVFLGEKWCGELDPTDPRVSPLYGDFAGLGPLTIFMGTRDLLNPDARTVRDKARAAGVEVDFHEAPGELHDYPLTPTKRGKRDAGLIAQALTAGS